MAQDLGYTSANTVFSDLNPKFGGVDISGPDLDFPLLDFIFFHPPYFVFPGSSGCRCTPARAPMARACGAMKSTPMDGSRISDQAAFKQWFDTCNANLYKLLRKAAGLATCG